MPKKQTTNHDEVQIPEGWTTDAIPSSSNYPIGYQVQPTRKRTTSLSGMLAAEPPETQKMLRDIARMVEVFKTEINEDPAIVAYLMRKINPEFSGDTMQGAFRALAVSEITATIPECISALQALVKSASNDLGTNTFYTTLYNTLAYYFLPSLSWNKIVLLGAYIQTINN